MKKKLKLTPHTLTLLEDIHSQLNMFNQPDVDDIITVRKLYEKITKKKNLPREVHYYLRQAIDAVATFERGWDLIEFAMADLEHITEDMREEE